jgi:hypothetical protein
MLVNNFYWYLANQDELVKTYNGKHLVIVDKKVVDAYDTHAAAYLNAEKKYGLGNFILQECTPGNEAYTAHCYTPGVSFQSVM